MRRAATGLSARIRYRPRSSGSRRPARRSSRATDDGGQRWARGGAQDVHGARRRDAHQHRRRWGGVGGRGEGQRGGGRGHHGGDQAASEHLTRMAVLSQDANPAVTQPTTVHDLSEPERARVAPYVTDPIGPVFALTGLPEVVKGALFARYSRSPKSLRRLLVDEFLPDSPVVQEAVPRVGEARPRRSTTGCSPSTATIRSPSSEGPTSPSRGPPQPADQGPAVGPPGELPRAVDAVTSPSPTGPGGTTATTAPRPSRRCPTSGVPIRGRSTVRSTPTPPCCP